MTKWIYTKQIPFTRFPGGVFGLGNFSILNSQDEYGNWRSDFTCIAEADDDEFSAMLECEKEFIRATIISAYLIGTGITQSRNDILDFPKIDMLNNTSSDVFKDKDYLLANIKNPTEESLNEFVKHANPLYFKLKAADIFAFQAGQYLNSAYAFFGDHKECITNFTKVVESIAIGITGNRRRYKLVGKTLKTLSINLNLTSNEINLVIDLNKTRNEIAAHGVLDPELEYIFNQYDPNSALSKYFVVTCGPAFGLGDKIMIFEPLVRKCFANYLDIEYIERPIFR